MECTEIHVIHSQRDAWAVGLAAHNARDRTLTVNAFLAEAVIVGQLDLNRNDLTGNGHRDPGAVSAPGNQDPAPADIFRVHG
jgi:hypothetical protein